MRKQRKRIYAALLSICMALSLVSMPVSAAETGEAAGSHEHTSECYTWIENCVHEHTLECYPQGSVSGNGTAPSEAAEPTGCSGENGCITKELNCPYDSKNGGTPATVESVQAMIDALPDAEEISAHNAEEVAAQLEAIDKAKAQLSGEELDTLDFFRYMEAAVALGSLSVPMLTANGTQEVSTAEALTSALADGSISEITLTGEIEISSTLTVNRTVTLDLNGFVLRMTSSCSVINVESGGDLTIKDSNPSAPHQFTPNSDGLWVLDSNGSETVTGGVITGGVASEQTFYDGYMNRSYYLGGGVYIAEGGKLTMTGGNIVGCSSEDGGGGVGLLKNASFTMTGGNIDGCTANIGGGISCYDRTGNKIEMSGTALIRDCRAQDSGGGIWNYGELYMTGATAIRGCIAGEPGGSSTYGDGGGVHVNSASSFVMSDRAVIEDCKVVGDNGKARGGGVSVANGASLTMSSNAKILNCSAENSDGSPSNYGGGVSGHAVTQITLEGNALIDQGNMSNRIGLYITGSTFSGYGNLYANGGSVNGDLILGNYVNYPCTITSTGTGRTAFNGTVTVQPGSKIENGEFSGTVVNNGTITGGEFTDTVVNNETITGGEFTTVINSESGTIAEGVSIAHLKFIVTFDNEGTKTTETVDNGGKLTEPTAPTKEGYYFDGWYYDNSGTKTKWVFDTDKVKYAMTLTAQWKEPVPSTPVNPGDTVRYIVEHYKAGSNGYTLEETEYSAGKIGDTVAAMPKTYTGFTYNPTVSTSGGILKKLSSAADIVTLRLYYDLTVYTVTVENDGNGSASATPVSATMGEAITLTAVPNSGYCFKEWQIVSGSVTISNNKFTMQADNVTVKAIFEKKSDDEDGDSATEETPTNPGTGNKAPADNPPTDNVLAFVAYTVQKGDTLWTIAKKYGCTVAQIVAANSDLIKNPNLIRPGWQLEIPQGEATDADNTPDAILPDNRKTGVYIVKRGDNLWAISRKCGCTVAEIIALNGELITDPNLIFAGWELKIPQD